MGAVSSLCGPEISGKGKVIGMSGYICEKCGFPIDRGNCRIVSSRERDYYFHQECWAKLLNEPEGEATMPELTGEDHDE